MRLEYRTCKLIEEKENTSVYKLKCSLSESYKWKQYIIEQNPIAEYKLTKCGQYEWVLDCLTDDPCNSVTIQRNGKDVNIADPVMTFIIPEYWQKRGIKEGFYEADERPNASASLKYYVRRRGENGEKDYTYDLQSPGGPGDPEYTYLKMLCDINDTFIVNYDDIIYNNSVEIFEMMTSLVPLNARTYITIEVPKDMKIN